MDAYRAGATGNTILQKTKELKKSHRVPLMIDQQPRVSYDRSRGREILANLVEMDRDDQDGPAEEDGNDNGGDDGGNDDDLNGNQDAVEMDRDDQDGPAEEDDDDNGGDDGGQDVVFTQQSFANKITKLGFAGNRKKILTRMGKMFRVRTREAPRADFLEGLSGQLHFDQLVEQHRWEVNVASEWEGVTSVTCNTEEEWRSMWREHREGIDSEGVRQDSEEMSEE